MENDVREETLYTIENVLFFNDKLFEIIERDAKSISGSERYHIEKSDETNEICSFFAFTNRKIVRAACL